MITTCRQQTTIRYKVTPVARNSNPPDYTLYLVPPPDYKKQFSKTCLLPFEFLPARKPSFDPCPVFQNPLLPFFNSPKLFCFLWPLSPKNLLLLFAPPCVFFALVVSCRWWLLHPVRFAKGFCRCFTLSIQMFGC